MNKHTNRMKFNKKIGLVLIAALFLVGCGKIEETIEEVVSSQEVSQVESDVTSSSADNTENETAVDARFVPEFSQVIAEFRNSDVLTLAEESNFKVNETFSQTQNNFQLSVENMEVFEVDSADESVSSEFNYEDNPGAVILMEVAITNLTDETIYYPIEGLRMSYQSADMQMHPSSALYPAQSGDLTKILEQNNGEIGPSMTVNGYLIYSFGQEEWEEASALGNVYLTVVPPQSEPDAISGVGASLLGDERILYLPLDEETQEQLSENKQMIPDRLSSEWWGQKTILAQDELNETSEDDDVSVELLRAEISDFEPKDIYEENFQNFNYGQIIVSIEYEVTNNSDHELLPVDGVATLQIGEDSLNSDYVLINDYNGTVIKPGDSYTTIKTFALDKLRYQEVWQGEPFYIAINTPVKSEDEEVLEEEAEEETIEVSDDLIYYFDFTWTPSLVNYINEDLDVVSESEYQTDSESLDESASEEEVEDSSTDEASDDLN